MNRIRPEAVDTAACPVETDPAVIAERYQEYLGDESRVRADSVGAIYLPETPEQVADALKTLSGAGRSCVLSAGRTGITGAVAPLDADAVVSLEKMNRVLAVGRDGESYTIRVQPGVTLADLGDRLARKAVDDLPETTDAAAALAAEEGTFWFPVDPTEMTAMVGGVVASNASGARTYRYGPTRTWVAGLTVILPDGRRLRVRRGEVTAEDGVFVLENADGSETSITLPAVDLPVTKATLGYAAAPDMDLVDLFVGSEGTLGAIVEAELRLAPRPPALLGVVAVVADEAKALDLVEAARGREDVTFEAIEYFDPGALALLKAKKDADGPGSAIPEIPSWDGAAVYLEIAGTEEETEEACEPLEEILAAAGSSLDDTWAAMEPDEIEAQKLFRHTVPEAVNLTIGQRAGKVPGLHKVGTDMAVPDGALRDVFALYRAGLAETGLDAVVFGHIGDNHVHVNILPEDLDGLKAAKDLYLAWAREVVRMNGAVAAEHGIGRIKKAMLEVQFAEDVLEAMRALRRGFDPKGTLAPGVLV